MTHPKQPPERTADADAESGPGSELGLGDVVSCTIPDSQMPEPMTTQQATPPSSSPFFVHHPPSKPPTLVRPYDVHDEIRYFLSIPWCRAHLQPGPPADRCRTQAETSPSIHIVQPVFRRAGRPVPDPVDGFYRSDPTAMDNAFSTTLHTPDTVGALLVFYEEPPASSTPTPNASFVPIVELKALAYLGPGLNGHVGVSHGGIVATLLDEILGLLIPLNRRRMRRSSSPSQSPSSSQTSSPRSAPEEAAEASAHIPHGFVTGYLNITYVRPVRTLVPVLVTARYIRKEGQRKFHVQGAIWDAAGQQLARADCLFIALREKL